jgi:hypothetical protein
MSMYRCNDRTEFCIYLLFRGELLNAKFRPLLICAFHCLYPFINSIKKQTVIKRFVSLRLLVVKALQRSRILVQIGK